MLGRRILQCNRLRVVGRLLLGCRSFHIARWLLVFYEMVTPVRGCTRMPGCTGNGIPRAKRRMRGNSVFPRARVCAEDSGYIRPDSVIGSSVYVWSVDLGIQRGLYWLGFGSPVVWCGGASCSSEESCPWWTGWGPLLKLLPRCRVRFWD